MSQRMERLLVLLLVMLRVTTGRRLGISLTLSSLYVVMTTIKYEIDVNEWSQGKATISFMSTQFFFTINTLRYNITQWIQFWCWGSVLYSSTFFIRCLFTPKVTIKNMRQLFINLTPGLCSLSYHLLQYVLDLEPHCQSLRDNTLFIE